MYPTTFKKQMFFTLGLLLFAFAANGQRPDRHPAAKPGEGFNLFGIVKDADSDQPLEFATITVFHQVDSSIVTGGITDDQGRFDIAAKPGFLFVKIEFLSYQSQTVENIQLGDSQKRVDMGTIALYPDASMLAEVEVRAEKSQLHIALDKKVFNVGKDLANAGGNATDVLDNVPSVNVDIDGNVSLRGSENVRLLVNGKPSGLVGTGDANGLRGLPASMIDRIEVVTNPSARYEAEGMAGIINIVLRKEQRKGFNGSFDVHVGYPKRYGIAANLNYRKKNLNFFANYGISNRNGPGGGFEENWFVNDDGEREITLRDREHHRGGWTNDMRFGADYFFNPKSILTTAFQWSLSDEDNEATLEYRDFLNDFDHPRGITVRKDIEGEDESELEYSLTYKKTFSQDDHQLIADLRYQDNNEKESSDFTESYFDGNFLPSGVPDSLQRSANEEGERKTIMQLDYIHPFSKDGKFETGVRASIRDIQNDFLVEEQGDDEIWRSLPNRTNDFKYDEDIYAAYVSYGNKHGKFSYQAGLRAEFSDVTTELLQTDEKNPRDYFNVFPSVHLTYDLPDKNAVQLSYSRRIVRPRFWFLNPFFTFSDARNFFSGNPNLDPEFTDSYELTHIKYWEKGSLSSAVFYRYSTDVMQRIREVCNNGTTQTKPQNLSTRDEYGLEFVVQYNPAKWWRFNADFNFLRSIIEGGNLHSLIDGTDECNPSDQNLDADTYTWNSRLMTRLTFWKSLDVQLSYRFRAPRQTTQGRAEAMQHLDLGISKDILKNNGTLTLSVRDLFNSRRREYTIEQPDYYADGYFQWRARSAVLSFNYRLNQKKKRQRGGGGFEGGDGGGGF